jgi:hypothetical protein
VSDRATLTSLLHQGVTQSGLELFAAYGINFDAASPRPTIGNTTPPVDYIGVAGFGGPFLNGFVALGASESLLRRSNHTGSTMDDWMGELANQLSGRIRNRLLRAGIPIQRVPPAVLHGAPESIFLPRTEAPFALTDTRDSVWIWIKTEPSTETCCETAAQDTSPRLAPNTEVLAEGEMLLF